ncbi:PQQ-binding-like beta-propeller repeat protein [Natronococcus sp. A-GB1]|uniref:outer membrane protein assembly factor BamB family protein n=1 Tax=Natronococcus sp. A-GB1 TaxID=3037648 RepID=UPI00241CE3A8|nr:PQQ-binding-like beta-propeller repeat protein [Natronococcus sp. A-GB1]MDG5758333.1 PQQ-binding-like beta-propeller repeat protein [Natronococcus sp. A-GB1]
MRRRAVLAVGACAITATGAGCFGRDSSDLETFDGEVSVDPSLAPNRTSWSVVHGDPANTRAVPPEATPEPPLSISWTESYKTHIGHVHPVVRDGTVVASDLDEELFAVDAETGEREWTAAPEEFESRTAPAVTEDEVLIGSRSSLRVFDRDGDERWRTEESVRFGQFRSDPTVTGDLSLVSTPLGLAAHDLEDGDRRWEQPIGVRPTATPASRDGTIYLGGGDATLHALEDETGGVRWRANADDEITAGPAVTDDVVYVGTGSGTVIAVDTDGTVRWGTEVADREVDVVAVGNGIVCASDIGGAISVVDPDSGDRVWRSERGASSYAAGPVIGSGLIFARVRRDRGSGSGSGETIGAFDAESGELEWQYDGDARPTSGPAVESGALYLTGHEDDRTSALFEFT